MFVSLPRTVAGDLLPSHRRPLRHGVQHSHLPMVSLYPTRRGNLPVEIHIPVLHFQKNKVSQPTFPALTVGEKLTNALGNEKKFSRPFRHLLGQEEDQISRRFPSETLVLYLPGRKQEEADVRTR